MDEQKKAAVDYGAGDKAAKWWFIAAALWFPVFTLFGFFIALKFFMPTFLSSDLWDTFGRLRPSHVNGVLFGFVSSGLIGIMLYVVPRLCVAQLRGAKLAKWAAVLWNANILAGIIGIMVGQSQGREYAELPFWSDVVVVVLLLVFTYIVFSTIIHRTERKLYPSLWFYAGTFVWFPIVYFIGNVMWRPPVGALNGTIDGIFNWYYGHNVLGLWFTTMGSAAWYYFIPKLIKRPLYSNLLSLIAFFTTVFFYTGVGAHHLLQAPLPEWLKTAAILMSVLMAAPVLAFATNILLTMRGSWSKVVTNAPLAFVLFGALAYIVASLQGSFQALRSTNVFLHFSQWPVGHAHMALLGGFGFLVVGGAYYLIPRITGKRIYGASVMNFSFWLGSIGFIFFFLAMTVAGLQQNANWWNHINVVETLPTVKIWFVIRAISGGTVVLAAFVFATVLLLTVWRGRQPYAEELIDEPAAGQKSAEKLPLLKAKPGMSLPTVMMAGTTMFVIMTFMVVAMPYMFTADHPSDRAHPLTDAEKRGETLYKSLGCFYCHSQFVRPTDWAMGEISNEGDFYYSVPNFLGTERTGPSLSQIGGKRPTVWEIEHYMDPRAVSPSSIMPPFAFLTDENRSDLAAYIQNLGTEDLNPQAFQPLVPPEYRDKSNPNNALMLRVLAGYDPTEQTFSGSDADAQAWADIFDKGKELYLRKCVSCHGCSGNGQGPYARNVITRPANIHERMINYPENRDAFHNWRISEGVPGTGMPAWKLSLDQETIWMINTYEFSFVGGAIRTIDGGVSDDEGDKFDADNRPMPGIAGTAADLQKGKELYGLYCTQCHGDKGHGDGPASISAEGGYIQPEPANFEESGADFTNYGRWVWKVSEGVETTNMPPWKFAFTKEEIYQVIFYEQSFSLPDDYNSKWAPLYNDSFAKNLMR